MSDDVYRKLAKVLDTLPNGFPAAESSAGIKLLEKIFDPDQAELFCDLRLQFETAQQIAERTGHSADGSHPRLVIGWRAQEEPAWRKRRPLSE